MKKRVVFNVLFMFFVSTGAAFSWGSQGLKSHPSGELLILAQSAPPKVPPPPPVSPPSRVSAPPEVSEPAEGSSLPVEMSPPTILAPPSVSAPPEQAQESLASGSIKPSAPTTAFSTNGEPESSQDVQLSPHEQLLSDLAAIQNEIENQKKVVAFMEEELAKDGTPDIGRLKAWATATGHRSKEYEKANPRVKRLIDEFEANHARNVWHAFRLAGGWAWGLIRHFDSKKGLYRKIYEVERDRSNTFIKMLEKEEQRLQEEIQSTQPASGGAR